MQGDAITSKKMARTWRLEAKKPLVSLRHAAPVPLGFPSMASKLDSHATSNCKYYVSILKKRMQTIWPRFTTFSIFLEQKLHLPVFLQPQLALYLHTKANLYDPFILSSSDYTINLLSFFIFYTCTQTPIYTTLLFSFP